MTDRLRAKVLASAREFFDARPAAPFVPGETYIPVTAKTLDASDLETLVESCLDLWFTSGRFARELEEQLGKRLQSRASALLVNSGSSANLVAIGALGLKPGDEVITAAAGFPTTVNPVLQAGAVPVFVDSELSTLNPSLDSIRAARGPRTRAVVLAHALGNPYRADELAKWCQAEGLALIEDCCDALGATIGGRPAGSFGDFATLSFYPAHHITTGEGGAVLARDARLRRMAEQLRDWGRDCWCETGQDNTCGKRFGWKLGGLPEGYDHKYIYSSLGYNLKMTDMQAALGVSQLKRLDAFVAARRANWAALREGVRQSPRLSQRFTCVEPTAGTEPSWFGFAIHCEPGVDRAKIVRALEARKVGTRLLFGGNLTKQPAYRGAGFRVAGTLTSADQIMNRTFWIGVHPGLDPARIAYMLEQLEAVAG